MEKGPLCPEPEDLRYEDLTKSLSSHKNSPLALLHRSERVCKPPPVHPLPRWLHRDPTKWSPAAHPPEPCPPAPYNPNRRAFEVNPHIPFEPLSLKPCPKYGQKPRIPKQLEQQETNMSNSVGDAATAMMTMPSIYANKLNLKPLSFVSVPAVPPMTTE